MIDSLTRKNPLLSLWMSAAASPERARREERTLTSETTRLWLDAILAAARPATRRKARAKTAR